MTFTVEDFRAGAKRAYDAGDIAAAEELARLGMELQARQPKAPLVGASEAPVDGGVSSLFGRDAGPVNVASGSGRTPIEPSAGIVDDIRQRRLRGNVTTGSALATGGSAGLTFNFSDEIGAGMIAPFVPETFAQVRDTLRASQDANQTARPLTYGGAQLGGSILGAVPAAVAGGAAVAPALPATLAGRGIVGAAAGSAGGAAEGALSAAGAATEGNRLAAAGEGAKVGALFGAAGGAAAPYLGAGFQQVAELVKGKDVGAIARALGISRQSAEVVRRSVEADDFAAAQRALQEAGPDAMLADAGPATGQLLDTAMQSSPTALRVGREAVETRAARAQTRLTGMFNAVLGAPEGIRAASRDIARRTASIRQRAYDRAYSQPIDYASAQGSAIEGVLARVDPATLRRAIGEANAAMRDAGTRNQQIMATISDAGDVTFTEMPNVQQLDQIKRALGDIAQSETDQITGRISAAGMRARSQSEALRDAIIDANKPYAVAVRLGGDKIAEQTALDAARGIVTTPLEDFQRIFAKPSKEALLAARRGLRTYIENAMSTVRRTVGDANIDAREALKPITMLSSRDVEQKMQMILSQDQYRTVKAAIDEAALHLGLRATVAVNSKTAARTAGREAVEEATQPGAFRTMIEGRPLEAGKLVVQTLTGAGPEIQAAQKQAIFAEISKALTQIRGEEAKAALQVMQRAIAGQPVKRIEAERISRLLTAATTVSAYQTATQAQAMP